MYPDPSKQPPFEKIACCLDFCPENVNFYIYLGKIEKIEE